MLKIDMGELAKKIKADDVGIVDEKRFEGIAIIGMSLKLPGASSADEFWENLKAGRDCVSELPPSRKSKAVEFLKRSGRYTDGIRFKKGGYLEKLDAFDCRFFNISPAEANLMDPNQRMFLETAYGAFEDAGYGGTRLKGTNTGVYLGFVSDLAYQRLIGEVAPEMLGPSIPGNMASVIPGRVSYALDLKGPAMLIDTACSSSLVAIHTACQALKNGDCGMAVAGSVKLCMLPLEDGNMLGIESKTYTCRAFDDDSDGTCMGEGVMAVVLKPVSKAVADGDHIYAVLLGSAVNQDGASLGITAPNALAQADVIRKAWADAGTDPLTVDYIEAHGTGTKLGDPVEIDGITRAFRSFTDRKRFCAVGSVKTNLGHLDSAAGLAGFMKAVLALKNGQIPPSLHYEKPNRNIDFDNSPVYVNARLADWERGEHPLRCGVSAFGLSGTNCHMILQEAPEWKRQSASETADSSFHLFTLSAKTPQALENLAHACRAKLQAGIEGNLQDLCFTMNAGRGHYGFRLAMAVQSIEELLECLNVLEREGIKSYAGNAIFYGETVKKNADEQAERLIGMLARTDRKKDAGKYLELVKELCRLYTEGAEVDWERFHSKEGCRRIPMPSYPFERRSCWVEDSRPSLSESGENNLKPIIAAPQIPGKGYETGTGELCRQEGKPPAGEDAAESRGLKKRPVILKGGGAPKENEVYVAGVFAKVLGFDEIDINDDFYDLGGDSILAAQAAAILTSETGKKVRPGDILANASIRELSSFIFKEENTQAAVKKIDESEIVQSGSVAAPAFKEGFGIPDLAPVGNRPYYPLSAAQKRVFLIEQLGNTGMAYNMPVAVKIKGKIDSRRIAGIFETLVMRHEAFKTSFRYEEDEPCQIIHERADFKLDFIHSEERELKETVQRLIQPFDLSKAPLFRACLIHVDDGTHVLFYDMHHIIADGVSEAILLREFGQLYANGVLEPLAIRYRDYAEWHNRFLLSEAAQKQSEYWQSVFRGTEPLPEMPTDFARPEVQEFEGKSLTFRFDEKTFSGIRDLAAKYKTTPNALMLTAYSLLISRCLGRTDPVVGSLTAWRADKRLENVIGMFVNFVPIKFRLDDSLSFAGNLKESARLISLAYENQDWPFEKIVEQSGLVFDRSRNPLYDTVFIFHNELRIQDSFHVEGLEFSSYDLERAASTLDYKMDVYTGRDGGLKCVLEYNSKLYKDGTMEDFARHYSKLVENILREPEGSLNDLEPFTPAEREAIENKRKAASYSLSDHGTDDEDNSNPDLLRIVVCSTFTSEPLKEYLSWWCGKFGIETEIRFTPYNQVFQQLLDHESMFSKNKGLNVLLVRFEDWLRSDFSSDGEKMRKLGRNFGELSRAFRDNNANALCFAGVLPVSDESGLSPGIKAELGNLNERWRALLKEFKSAREVDFTDIAKWYGIVQPFDSGKDREGHMPFSDAFEAAMGVWLARNICAWRGRPFKVIALDCDNTLWKGVCGEAQDGGVVVEPGYGALQQFMLEKSADGMLLALCSKNNEKEVWDVFEKNPGMRLSKDHLAAWRINWERKSENLRSMAKELNLGLDSFIFIDDSPQECTEVMESCPEVLTLCLPGNPDSIPMFLRHVWAFDTFTTTKEDRERTRMMLSEKKRGEARSEGMTLEEYINGLELEISFGPMREDQLERVAQLTQRTNQFNLSTIRRNENEIRELLKEPGTSCFAVEVKDRFGDYGLTGVIITRLSGETVLLDTFLLSCRVLGRGVEDAVLSMIGRYCREAGAGRMEAGYRETPKNKPLRDFLGRTGWRQLEREADAEAAYAAGPDAEAPAGIAIKEFELFWLDVIDIPPTAGSVKCHYGSESGTLGKAVSGDGQAHPFRVASDLERTVADSLSDADWNVIGCDNEKLLHQPYLLALNNHKAGDLLSLAVCSNTAPQYEKAPYSAPKGEVEIKLAEAWKGLLKVDNIGAEDNFFAMGGHSLKAASLVSRIGREFGVELSLTDVFRAPTIRKLAARIAASAAGTLPSIVPVENREHYPLSTAQKRIFIISCLNKNSTGYNIPAAVRIDGKIDARRVDSALEKLIERHEALRTSFCHINGEPAQIVHEHVDFKAATMEVGGDWVGSVISGLVKPFDISKAPLFRVCLVKVPDKGFHVLYFEMHHLIGDGISFAILMNEFMQLYMLNEIPVSRLRYRDYAVWQNRMTESGMLDRQKSYWRNRLAELPPAAQMPYDFQRSEIRRFEGSRFSFDVSPALCEALRSVAGKNGTTLNILMISIYALLYGSFGNAREVVVGTVVSGRHHPGLDSIIGVFINYLPLRFDFKVDEGFTAYLARASSMVAEAYGNQDWPFEKMVEEASIETGRSRNPVFDTAFLLHDEFENTQNKKSYNGLEFSDFEIETAASALDFKLDVFPERAGGLGCVLEYDTSLFLEKTMREFVERFSILLEKITENPGLTLEEIRRFPACKKRDAGGIPESRKNPAALNIAICATFTAEPIGECLSWCMNRMGIESNIAFSPYNQVFRELLDPESLFSRNTGVNILLVRFEDFARNDCSNIDMISRKLNGYLQELTDVVRNMKCKTPCIVGIFPPEEGFNCETRLIQDINGKWKKALEPQENMNAVEFAAIEERFEDLKIFDARKNESGHMPFTDEFEAAAGVLLSEAVLAAAKDTLKGDRLPEIKEPFPANAKELVRQVRMAGTQRNGRKAIYAPPATDTERRLAGLWADVLGQETVGLDDDFFELGGGSLKAVAMVSRLYAEFGAELTLGDIIDNTTVRGLAKTVENARNLSGNVIKPAEGKEHYPLSPTQRRLFAAHCMDSASLSYNEPAAVEVRGPLDIDKVRQVFLKLIERHDALRTSFEMIDNVPAQIVAHDAGFEVELTETEGTNLDTAIRAFFRPFDLSRAPLLRVGVIRKGKDSHILICDLHHIISDEMSMSILIREFVTLYGGGSLPAKTLNYIDYSEWMNGRIAARAFENQREYWQNKLGGTIPPLDLPLDFIRPDVRSYDGKTCDFSSGASTAESLEASSKKGNVTPFMLCLAAYNLLLHKHCGSEDIVVGTPFSGRQVVGTEGLIGSFINTLAMRNRPEPGKSVSQFVNEVRQNALEAFANSDYPFEEVLEKLDIERIPGRNPLFDTVFSYHTDTSINADVGGLEFLPCRCRTGMSKYDLTLHVYESRSGFSFTFEYATSLFRGETIEGLAADYQEILEQVLREGDALLREIRISSGNAKHTAIEEDFQFDFTDGTG